MNNEQRNHEEFLSDGSIMAKFFDYEHK